MSDLEVLKQRKPAIAEFIEQWRKKYENRVFDFKKETEQADFYEAMLEMARHIAHTADSAKLVTAASVDGMSTVYANVSASKSLSPS